MKSILSIPLLFLLFSPAGNAAPEGPPNRHPEFIALKGAEASNFKIPDTSRLMRTQDLKKANTVSKRYQQWLGDAEVLGGQLTVLTTPAGETVAVIGAHYPGLMSTNDIKINDKAAQAIAVKNIGNAGKWSTKLMINPADGRYFYHVENQRADSRWFYWIDATNGSVVNAYDGLTTGSGIGVDGNIKSPLDTTWSGSQYQMVSADGRQKTYDAKNKSTLPGILAVDSDDNWNLPGTTSPGQPALVDAHFFANVTDDYYQNIHNFDWMSEYPQGMVSSAHLKRKYNNAYWNGVQVAYGDGDGVTFINFSGDLDVVAHELTHGVTEATSNLIYQNESGALNESFSDIMGTNTEFYFNTGNWTIGEDITPGDNGIRNMADPTEDGYPDNYADRYTGTSDNGGVHINSSIVNHWYYLLATETGGIGLSAADQIAYKSFTSLNSTADFCDARAATIAVATNSEESHVTAAWDLVGVTEAICGASSDPGTGDAPIISDVSSTKLKGLQFRISWTTNEPATTEVSFTCCGTYVKNEFVTSHSYTFSGTKGAVYTYYVSSTDVDKNKTTAGPFTHQN